ncbi:MAG: hypothetical protein IKZ16_08215 [Clostridia bacterium]|nr:hypothetical protein [Clostridia bacterium]
MQQIYTIPVHEAFEAGAADHKCGCPLCALYRKLEENELDLILGASMMEPDVRIKTNEKGFCRTHYDMMFTRKNRLGMALTLESHLNQLKEELETGFVAGLIGKPGSTPLKRIERLEKSCYVCERIEFHFQHMAETVVYLFESEDSFAEQIKAQPYFCLPHYRLLLEKAQARLQKKKLADFFTAVEGVQKHYLDTLREDVSWFCKKFDYRYDNEPWYNSKDAVERAFKFLRSDLHKGDKPKKQ